MLWSMKQRKETMILELKFFSFGFDWCESADSRNLWTCQHHFGEVGSSWGGDQSADFYGAFGTRSDLRACENSPESIVGLQARSHDVCTHEGCCEPCMLGWLGGHTSPCACELKLPLSGVGGLFVSKAGRLGFFQDGWSALESKASNFKHLGSSKITSSIQLPPKKSCDPCLVENSQRIFWYYCWLAQILQVCPLELSLKSRHLCWEVGRLQSWQ